MNGLKKHKTLIVALLAAVSISVVVLFLIKVDLFQKLEYTTLDQRFKVRKGFSNVLPDPRLTLISIDDESTVRLGRWPFPRTFHAEVLTELAEFKPNLIAWDVLFVDPDQTPENDIALVEACKLFPKFITSASLLPSDQIKFEIDGKKTKEENDEIIRMKLEPGLTKSFKNITGDRSKILGSSYGQLPIEGLKKCSYFGFVNCDPDKDGVRRRAPMLVEFKGELYPSLSLATVLHHLDVSVDQVTIDLGRQILIQDPSKNIMVRIPIDERGLLQVNFRRSISDFFAAGYAKLVMSLGEHKENPSEKSPLLERIKRPESILFVGVTGTGLGDAGAIPLEELNPLVVVHLNAISSILDQDFLSDIPTKHWFPFYFVAMLGLAALMARWRFLPSIWMGIVALPLYALFSYVLFARGNLILPTFVPMCGIGFLMLAITAQRYNGEVRDKARVKKILGSYLSEKIMREVLDSPDGVRLGGTKQEITVMFCDIRGFTRYCEKRDPEHVLGVLNEYLEAMTDVIIKYDGTLDKYIGDAIMAFWGAPQHQPDHAQRAVCAAIEMRYALGQFKSKKAGQDMDLFECGIGLHTGEAIVGNMGTERHKNYTTIGATVNMAARLEALTKQFNSRIVISEATLKQIEGNFTITELGEALIPGFTVPARLYSVEAAQDINSALNVGRVLAQKRTDQSEEAPAEPLWKPAPLPEDES